jgi:chromosomal replication initiation ATPase DnaA
MNDPTINRLEAQVRDLQGQIEARRQALLAEALPKGTMRQVLDLVGRDWGVEAAQMIGDDRGADIVTPRFVAMTLACRVLGYSQARVARIMNRSPATVGNACRTIAAQCEADSLMAARLDRLAERIKAIPRTRNDA